MSKTLWANILRLLLGVLFVATAIGKLLDNRGFATVLASYHLFPQVILLWLGLAFSLLELYLGLSVILGRRLALNALLMLGVNAAYTVLAIITLLRGIHLANCGCFGIFLPRELTWMTPVEDAALVGASLVFFWLNRHSGTRRIS